MSVEVRRAENADLAELRKLSIASFTNAYAQFNTKENMARYLAENFSEEKIAREFSNPQIVFLLAFDSNQLVGYVKLNLARVIPEASRPVEIARLYSAPERIGQGIGKKILEAVEQYALDNHHDAIVLDAWQKNYRSVNFYQREGFTIIGLTKFHLGDDVQDDFIMLRKVIPDEIVIETERLYLRRFVPRRDAKYFLALVNSEGWLKYIGDRNVRTEQDAMKYIYDRVMKGYADNNGYGGYTIIEKSSGKPIGNAGLYKRPVLDHFDVGYALLPEFHGKGYAFEASAAVLNYARQSGMKRIYAITVAYNERSIHLLEKLGLKFEKFFRMEGDPEELSLYSMEL